MAPTTRIVKFPSAEQVSGPASMRPSGAISVADTSAIGEGLDALDRGARGLAQGVSQYDQLQQKKQATSEVAKAEAAWLSGSLALGNKYQQDSNYQTFGERSEADTLKLRDGAAALITDPEVKQRWLDETELRRLTLVDGIGDRGREIERQTQVVDLGNALQTSADVATDPMTPKDVRDRALRDIDATIDVAVANGLVEPAAADKLREDYVRGSKNTLAARQVELDIRFKPDFVRGNVGIPNGTSGSGIAAAISTLSGGQPVPMDYTVAGDVAKLIGDNALPTDPKLREAYLSDPETNAKYVEGALNYLDQRYKGDVSATIVASVPGGSLELADQWAKHHDEAKLPPAVRDAYRRVVQSMAPEAELVQLPVIAADGVNLEAMNVGTLQRWEAAQSTFGQQLTVISASRDAEHNAAVGGAEQSRHLVNDALDIDVSKLSKEERVRLLQTVSAQGFTGIGVYANSIHIDMGKRRAWGRGDQPVPAWAAGAIEDHLAGKVATLPAPTKGVAPEYADLTFDQRLAAYDKAKIAVDNAQMSMKSGLEVDIANAPTAIMNTGAYDRPMPTAADFVAAWGSAKGIELWKPFDASVQAAEIAYGMRTESNTNIASMVEAAMPTSSGDMAAAEQDYFEKVSAAAKSVLDAREKDPAGYTMQVFPAVADAWENAGDDPVKFQQAIARMALGQEQLGIEQPKLLPADIAKQGADTFNNPELSQAERIGAIAHLTMATNEPGQQEAIFDQLVGAGVPPMARAAMAALTREGDPLAQAAAERLFAAATVDPDKLAKKLPNSLTDAQVESRISEMLFDTGEIGDVMYGVSNGTADNLDRFGDDGALIENSVKLRLLDGSASTLDQAIDQTARDMWGDVQVVTGQSFGGGAGVRIVLPKDQDPKPMVQGFNALLPTVGDAIMADLTPAMSLGVRDVNDRGQAATLTRQRDLRVSDILETGYFASQGDAYVFIDATTGQAVPDPGGPGVLTFTKDEVMQASVISNVQDAQRVRSMETGSTPQQQQFGAGGFDLGTSQ